MSRGSCRGVLVDPVSHRLIAVESYLEFKAATVLLADRRVTDLREQPAAVPFKRQGRTHLHTFDFAGTFVSSKRIAFAVKPRAKVVSSGLASIVNLIAAQGGGGFDAIKIVTEDHVPQSRFQHAAMILRARRDRPEAPVAAVMDLVSRLHGAVRICEITRHFDQPDKAFLAILCLIDDGILSRCDEAPLHLESFVRLTRESGEEFK